METSRAGNKKPAGWQAKAGKKGLTVHHSTQLLPRRQRVLIVSHPDGLLEVFGDGLDVCIERLPQAQSIKAETTAEDVLEMRLPLRFRQLHDRSKLAKNGSTAPLKPSVLRRAIATSDLITTLNSASALLEREEVTVWS